MYKLIVIAYQNCQNTFLWPLILTIEYQADWSLWTYQI